MTTSRPPALLLVIPILMLLLSACGGGQSASPGQTAPQSADVEKRSEAAKPAGAAPAPAATTAAAAAAPKAAAAAKPADAAANDSARGAGGTGAGPGAPAAAATPAAAASNSRVAAAAGQIPALDQRIIRTGRIDVVVADVAAALRTITDLVRGAGGFIQQSATRDQGNVAVAEMVLRVPVEQYDPVFQGLRDLAVPDKKPVEDSTSQDVTEEFADTEARIRNLKSTEEQILRLLARAEKIEDILTIQRELTGVREQIERLQGRLNVLERRSAYSTITVTLRPPEEAKKPSPPALGEPVGNATEVSTRPRFTWAISEGATSYTVQVTNDIDSTFAAPIHTFEKLQATSVEWPESLEELRPDMAYRWRVRGSNPAGDGEWSQPRTFRTVTVWNPLRTAGTAWEASLKLLQRVIDGVLRVVIFFWWLIPLLVLLALPLRSRVRLPDRFQRPTPAPTPPPADAPPAAD